MISVLVARCTGAAPRREVPQRVAERATDQITFFPNQLKLRWDESTSTLVFVAESDVDPTPTYERCLIDEDGFLIILGTPVLETAGADGTRELRERLWSQGAERVRRSVRGHYTIISQGPGGDMIAFSDFSGVHPVFTWESDGVVAISDRQMLLQATCSHRSRLDVDLEALAWLQQQANIMGDRGVVAGTRFLRPDRYFSVARDGSTKEASFSWQPWRGPGGEPTEADFDRVTASMVETARGLGPVLGPEPMVSLTGGKDSRLNLALLMASGLSDRATFFTAGPKASPEIGCAASVASMVGVEHVPNLPDDERGYDREETWHRLHDHPFRFEGTICPWDAVESPASTTHVEVHGWGGELYKVHAKHLKDVRYQDAEHAARLFRDYQQPGDPLGVLTEDVRAALAQVIRGWIDEQLELGVARDDLDGVLYNHFRLPLWSGIITSNQLRPFRVFPLLNHDAAALAYGGRKAFRAAERLHLEVMRRIDERLVTHPFLDDRWGASILEAHPELDLPTEPFQGNRRPVSRNLVTWKWPFLEREGEELAEIVLSSPSSGLFEICDAVAVTDAVLRDWSNGSIPEVKAILSLLEMQLFLTGSFTSAKEGAPGRVVVDTNMPALEQPLRGSLSFEPFRSPVVEARLGLKARRNAMSHLARGLDPARLAESLSGTGAADLRVLLPSLSFELPVSGEQIQHLRIDPADRACTVAVGTVRLRSKESGEMLFSLDPKIDLSEVRQAQPRMHSGGATVFEVLGDDPQFHLRDVGEHLADVHGPLILELDLIASEAVDVEVFWDVGDGFSRHRKATGRHVPTAMSRLVASGLGLRQVGMERRALEGSRQVLRSREREIEDLKEAYAQAQKRAREAEQQLESLRARRSVRVALSLAKLTAPFSRDR